MLRQLAKLAKQQLIESNQVSGADRLYRLTERGRLHALGGRDPRIQWSRHWDGRWRLVLFDVPIDQNSRRERLRRHLRSRAFGCLQGSVWVTPDPVHGEREILAGSRVNVESLLLMEARPCAGESDAEIVNGAWDFEQINRRYSTHLKLLEQRPGGRLSSPASYKRLRCWAADEHEAWIDAVTHDPLLPERLLPSGYTGRQAWQRRIEVLQQAGQQLRTIEQ